MTRQKPKGSQSPQTVPVNMADSELDKHIIRLATEQPDLGQAFVADLLRKQGIQISPSGVRYIWKKYGLETRGKRLAFLAASTEEGLQTLSENQRQVLARDMLTSSLKRPVSAPGEGADNDDSGERRQIILTVAAELFSERGYKGTSIRDIAGKAGLQPGSVYHHYPSKQDIYLSVHQAGFHNILNKVKQAIEQEEDPWARLLAASEVHIGGIVEGSPIERLVGRGLAHPENEELLEPIRALRVRYEEVFKVLIAALPLKPETNTTLLRLFLFGSMNWVFVWYREGRMSAREISKSLIYMIKNGA